MIRRVGNDFSIAQHDVPLGIPCDAQIVSHKDDCQIPGLIELLEKLDHFSTGARVEVPGRFVTHEDRRIG